jgi:hypothetical protein
MESLRRAQSLCCVVREAIPAETFAACFIVRLTESLAASAVDRHFFLVMDD